MLAVTWFLSAGLQWGQEAIDVKAAYLHGIVWTLASVQTTAVLILKKIEGIHVAQVDTLNRGPFQNDENSFQDIIVLLLCVTTSRIPVFVDTNELFQFLGDILSGVCFVGVLDEAGSLLVFVPLGIYMTFGFFFLVLGIISLVRIRSVMKRDGTKTDKLEKLIGRIGNLEFYVYFENFFIGILLKHLFCIDTPLCYV